MNVHFAYDTLLHGSEKVIGDLTVFVAFLLCFHCACAETCIQELTVKILTSAFA